MNCTVVIAAYNEAVTIRDVVRRTLAQMSAVRAALPAGMSLLSNPSVIVVDDGSTDGTVQALTGLPVTVLRNATNEGKAMSIWRGAQRALADGAGAVITLDGDAQHSPEDIPRLLHAAATRPGAIVIGARLHARERIPLVRYGANRFANFWIAWAAGQPIADSQSGFRLYPATVFRDLYVGHERRSSFVFESEVLIEASKQGFAIVSVPVSVTYANAPRASHFRPVADFWRISTMVAGRLLRDGMNLPGLVRSLRLPGGSRVHSSFDPTPRTPSLPLSTPRRRLASIAALLRGRGGKSARRVRAANGTHDG